MNRTYKTGWFVFISFIFPLLFFGIIVFIFWWLLPPSEKRLITGIPFLHLKYFLGAIGVLLLGLGLILEWLWYRYVLPVSRLSVEAALIKSSNPAHRIEPSGSPDLQKLCRIINEWASQRESEQADIETRITKARSESETQKNILAAFMAELPEGVIICNASGKMLFYNKQAKLLFAARPNDIDPKRHRPERSYQFVGLGRWINDVIDPHLVQHAVDEIKSKLEKKESDIAAYFIISQSDRMLRVEAVPILDHLREFSGFVLIFYDITAALQVDGRAQFLWQTLTHDVRSAVTSIRSAIETILAYPDMAADRKKRLEHLIHDETLTLGKTLDDTMKEYRGCCTDSRWPLVFIKDRNLINLLEKKISEKPGFELTVAPSRPSMGWVRVDTYSMTLALMFMINQIKQATGVNRFTLQLKKSGQFIGLDIIWKGAAIKIEHLKKWQDQPVVVDNERLAFSLKEVMGYHHMDIGSYPGKDDATLPHIRIFMPVFTSPEPVRKRSVAILPESRPEFFDFDLFHQAGQDAEVDRRRLDELSYTVFDTETTGLDISNGDKIVSIAAVRIVNAKILMDEQFNQLVNPGRKIPATSTEYHGITDDMVIDQPVVEDVLPRFYRFVDETVLVAHNAAFDMRLLEINEPYTGLKFDNPVLDTLLLSAVAHPSLADHDLEHIAKRLGVKVRDRHTALGDAITTATIFLKLIPILAQMGIFTLKDARDASQQTYYARLKY